MKKKWGVCQNCNKEQVIYLFNKASQTYICLSCINEKIKLNKEKKRENRKEKSFGELTTYNKLKYLFKKMFGKKPTQRELFEFATGIHRNNYYIEFYNFNYLKGKKKITDEEIGAFLAQGKEFWGGAV